MELTTDLVLREQTFSGRTYQLSQTKIEGFVDELEALKQRYTKSYPQSSMNIQFIASTMGLPGRSSSVRNSLIFGPK